MVHGSRNNQDTTTPKHEANEMEQNMTQTKPRVAKWKAGLAALALGALLVIPAGAQEQLSDTGDVSFEVEAGYLTVGLVDGSLAAVPFSVGEESTTGSIGVEVTDERGGNGEWDVLLQAGPFVGDETEDVIPASALSYTGYSNENETNGTEGAVDYSGVEGTLDDSVEIASGVEAHGAYTWDAELSLDVPGSTLADTYHSELTLTEAQAPNGE
jgi:hypothetical protein